MLAELREVSLLLNTRRNLVKEVSFYGQDVFYTENNGCCQQGSYTRERLAHLW